MFEQALPVFVEFMSWPSPLILVLGVLIGMLFGVLPGLGGPQVLALLLPLTFAMDSTDAIILLIGAAGAVPFGGSITAILINTPGDDSFGSHAQAILNPKTGPGVVSRPGTPRESTGNQ